MEKFKLDWLAADYHFGMTYSIRVPLSSISSVTALPTPGPATVRLALIKAGLELFGYSFVRDNLFPTIREMEIQIKPPDQVAMTNQTIRAFKASPAKVGKPESLQEALTYREVAHSTGNLTIYLKVPEILEATFREMLAAIGYWGQTDGLVSCLKVYSAKPNLAECILPLEQLANLAVVSEYYISLATEFRDSQVGWEEIIPGLQTAKTDAIQVKVFIWPLIISQQNSNGKVLQYKALITEAV